MAISDRIRHYRKNNHLTQSQLAELIGVSSQAVSKWETGNGYPDLSLLVPLASALQISTDELLESPSALRPDGVRAEWNSMAAAYECFVGAADSYSYTIEWPCVQELLPDLRGKTILDVGCGTGIFTFLLEKYDPAQIVGIDLSEEMLKIAAAKAKEKKSKARFLLGDAQKLAGCADAAFDLVFSSTTTHYLPHLNTLFENIRRVLKAEGTCVLSVIHPVYSAQYPIEHGDTFPTEEEWRVRYLDKRNRAYIQPWIEYNDQVENQLSRSYHHTFGDYVNAIVQSGLKIRALREPMPPEAWKTAAFGRYDAYLETPTFLVMRLER